MIWFEMSNRERLRLIDPKKIIDRIAGSCRIQTKIVNRTWEDTLITKQIISQFTIFAIILISIT